MVLIMKMFVYNNIITLHDAMMSIRAVDQRESLRLFKVVSVLIAYPTHIHTRDKNLMERCEGNWMHGKCILSRIISRSVFTEKNLRHRRFFVRRNYSVSASIESSSILLYLIIMIFLL